MKIFFKILCVFLLFLIGCTQKPNDKITVSEINKGFLNHNLEFPEGSIFLFLESKHGLTSDWANLKVRIPKDKLATFQIKNDLSDFVKKAVAAAASYPEDPKWDLKPDTEVFEPAGYAGTL